ncbi:MAG: hypothetical protein BAJATHORv1_40340 [Candidatus Thorarchaeota archaeon]|nr:MAG: hypothetical protein BAJATHORv1_40340 [Candidatus Thorarchaeota archaeon]
MILKKMKLKHIKCFEESEVEFSVGKNVIVGRNGSGKSTLFQSILFSLYAEYPLGNNDELIRLGENSGSIELEFEHKGEPYVVSRQISSSGPDARLYQVSTDTELATKQTKTTEEIEKLLGIRKDVFRDIIWVGQGEIAQIISMGNKDRKDLFDKLLGLYDFETAHKKCRPIERKLESSISQSAKLSEVHEKTASKFDQRKTVLKELETDLTHKKSKVKDIQSLLEDAKKKFEELDALEKRISKLHTVIEQKQEEIDDQISTSKEYKTSIPILCKEVNLTIPESIDLEISSTLKNECDEQIGELTTKISKYRKEKEKCTEKASRLDTLRSKLPQEKADFDELKDSIEAKKVAILSEVPSIHDIDFEDWTSHIGSEIKKTRVKKEELENNLSTAREIESRLQSKEERLSQIQKTMKGFQSEIADIRSVATQKIGNEWRNLAEIDLRSVSAKIRGIETKIEKLTTQQREQSKNIAKLETKIERSQSDLADLSKLDGKKCPKCKQIVDEKHSAKLRGEIESQISQYTDQLQEVESSLSELESKLTSLNDEKEDYQTKKDHVSKCRDYAEREESWIRKLDDEKEESKKIKDEIKTLKDELTSYDIISMEEEISILDTKITELVECRTKAEQIPELVSSLTDKESSIEILESDILELEKQEPDENKDKLTEKISAIENQLDVWRELTNAFESLQLVLEKLQKLNKTLASRKSELSNLENKFDSEEYDELSANIEAYKEQISSLKTRIATLSQDQIPQAKELFEESKEAKEKLLKIGEKGVKAEKALRVVKILRSYYREVQKPLRRRGIRKASQNATEIFKEIMVSNEFDRIRITHDHELRISRTGSFEPMSTLSGGEQVIAGLSVRLGFARALASSDLLLLDEPTAYLDDQRRAELVETLNRITPARQILIVTHDDEFERVAQKVIHVRKDEGMFASSIE